MLVALLAWAGVAQAANPCEQVVDMVTQRVPTTLIVAAIDMAEFTIDPLVVECARLGGAPKPVLKALRRHVPASAKKSGKKGDKKSGTEQTADKNTAAAPSTSASAAGGNGERKAGRGPIGMQRPSRGTSSASGSAPNGGTPTESAGSTPDAPAGLGATPNVGVSGEGAANATPTKSEPASDAQKARRAGPKAGDGKKLGKTKPPKHPPSLPDGQWCYRGEGALQGWVAVVDVKDRAASGWAGPADREDTYPIRGIVRKNGIRDPRTKLLVPATPSTLTLETGVMRHGECP